MGKHMTPHEARQEILRRLEQAGHDLGVASMQAWIHAAEDWEEAQQRASGVELLTCAAHARECYARALDAGVEALARLEASCTAVQVTLGGSLPDLERLLEAARSCPATKG